MPLSALSAVVATAARSVTVPDTDGELLRRFVRSGEEPAFAALVRRLGPMVLGVCRRVSGDSHLAEDAFQAAFVVLARRASEVRPAEAVRAWLYGVAVRTARGVRAVSARRLARETPVAALPDRAGEPIDPPDADVLAVLDEEVAGLPEHLRVAVVLCELDGLSRRDAAERLAIAEGTLSSRLAKARKLLADRLRKRGVSLPAAGLAVLATSAPVSAKLAARTSAFASAGAPLPPAVAALSNGVFRTMFLHKLTLGAACALVLAAAGFALWGTQPNARATEPPKFVFFAPADKPDEVKPAAKPIGPGTLLLAGQEGKLVALTPEGKEQDELNTPKDTRSTFKARLSPDGTRAAFVIMEGPGRGAGDDLDAPWPFQVVIRKLGATESKVVDFPGFGVELSWAPDGKRLAVTKYGKDQPDGTVLLDPETGKTEPLDLPTGVRVLDWSQDGKTFLVIYLKDKKYRLGLTEKGDKEARELTELKVRFANTVAGRLSADGKKVLFTDADPEEKDAYKWHRSSKPHVLDVATKKRQPLVEFPENAQCVGVAWSPDGKRVAYAWSQLHPEVLKKDRLDAADVSGVQTEAFLIVADADGKNAKTVASAKSDNALNAIYGSIDWR